MLPGQGQPQCAWAPSPFRASREDQRHELDYDFQMIGSELDFGNESSSVL